MLLKSEQPKTIHEDHKNADVASNNQDLSCKVTRMVLTYSHHNIWIHQKLKTEEI